jgi:hypothetical protein
MNIVQAYTKINKQNIILVSGFSGSNKTIVADFLAELFQFKHLNVSKFYYDHSYYDKAENYVDIDIESNNDNSDNNSDEKHDKKIRVLDWDNIYKSVDWDKLNESVNVDKHNGIIVSGFGFPQTLLKFLPNFHLHIKINKQNLIANREKYFERKKKNHNMDVEKKILNTITYPHYIKIVDDSKIDKFINTNNMSIDQVKKEAFDYLISSINKQLNNYNENKLSNAPDTMDYSSSGSTVGRFTESMHGKNQTHHDGYSKYYNEYLQPNDNGLYDFNEIGIDYDENYKKQHNQQTKGNVKHKNKDNDPNSIDSSTSDISSSSSSSSIGTLFLYTSDGPR